MKLTPRIWYLVFKLALFSMLFTIVTFDALPGVMDSHTYYWIGFTLTVIGVFAAIMIDGDNR